jgi:hypothetical protein
MANAIVSHPKIPTTKIKKENAKIYFSGINVHDVCMHTGTEEC